MGPRLTKKNHRIGKNGCYLPNCKTCGYTKKYLQDKSRYKLLCSIFPKQTAFYMRELAVENFTKTEVPNHFSKNVDYQILVKMYDILIRHVEEKHDGYVFLAGEFTTFMEGLTQDFSFIDFFVFSSFRRSTLLSCIPSLFRNLAEQLRERGFDSEVNKVQIMSPLTNFYRIHIEISCSEKQLKLNNELHHGTKFRENIKNSIEVFKICIHISNGKNQYLEQNNYLYPFEFRRDNEQKWLKHNDLKQESRDNIYWLTKAKQLIHDFQGTMFDSVLHPDWKKIYRFNWPELIKQNEYIELGSEDVKSKNDLILEKLPRFPVKSLFRLAWENVATEYDE